MKAVLTLSSPHGNMNPMPSKMSSAQHLQPHLQHTHWLLAFSPISHDLSSSNDIGFHTIELLLTFDLWGFFCKAVISTLISITCTHTQHTVSYNFMLYFSHIMLIRISLSVKFYIHCYAILFNSIISLETVLIPMID